jgi:hypothetical protein
MKHVIIYNDETNKTQDFVNWYKKNYSEAVKRTPRKYSYGCERLEVEDLKKTLNNMLSEQKTKFVITDKVEHYHNIGNNNLFEVRCVMDKNDIEVIICKIALNSGLYGDVHHYIENLSGDRICD